MRPCWKDLNLHYKPCITFISWCLTGNIYNLSFFIIAFVPVAFAIILLYVAVYFWCRCYVLYDLSTSLLCLSLALLAVALSVFSYNGLTITFDLMFLFAAVFLSLCLFRVVSDFINVIYAVLMIFFNCGITRIHMSAVS